MKFELFPSGIPIAVKSSAPLIDDESADLPFSDGSTRGGVMPIEKLKVHGNQLSQTRLSPPSSPHPHPPATATSLRRYEFIRRSLTRGDKPSSPTFVIEGKKVTHKQQASPLQNGENHVPPTDSTEESKLDFDPMAFLDNKPSPVKGSKGFSPPKPKSECVQSAKGSATSVVLPVLHIEGPGFSHQLRSKSSSLPGDDQPTEVEDMMTEPAGHADSIWSELENIDHRNHRAIKKNNFFIPAGARIGEDHPELCVENAHRSKTITLHLNTATTSHEKQKPTNGLANNTLNSIQHLPPKHTKSPRDKLYRSATHIASGSRPLFQSVSAYLNYNPRRAGLYSSEQYLDSSRMDNALRPLENQLKRPISKKLVAKYSDMEIQRELNDFFKIRSVR